MNPDRFKTTITIECFPSTFMELYKKLETVKELVFSPSVKLSVYNVYRKDPNELGQYYVILEGESVKLSHTDFDLIENFFAKLYRYWSMSITQDVFIGDKAQEAFLSVWPPKKT